MKLQRVFIYILIVSIVSSYAGLQVRPLPSVLAKIEAEKDMEKTNPNIVYRFFEESFVSGGYEYHYPDDSRVYIAEESGKNGEVSVQMDLVANDYSGGAVVLWNLMYDLKPYYCSGALEFWIKGKNGGEIANACLADDETGDGIKTEVRVPINDYADITTAWTHVSIPLADFGKRGAYWDAKKKVEVPYRFDWRKVMEFLITIEKGKNRNFTVWVDDIYIVKDVYDPVPDIDEVYWDEVTEIVSAPDKEKCPTVDVVKSIFVDEFGQGSYTHVYGGKTAVKIQPTNKIDQNPSVLGFYTDNADYSGATINFGAKNKLDLSGLRENRGGIAFWAKFGKGVESVFLGLLDDDSDKKMVQSTVVLTDYAKPDTAWQYYMIPLKSFNNQGSWWDEDKQAEVPDVVDWGNIVEFSITTDKYGNRLEDGVPVVMYIDDICLIKEVPGYVDPDVYWNAFSSNAEDILLFDFEKTEDHMWEAVAGEESDVFFEIGHSENRDKFGKHLIHIEYSMNDWCYVEYPLSKNSAPMELRDWTKHRAIMFDFFTERDEEIITVQINDEGKEGWVANVTCTYGWQRIILPLKKFRKYPYYQPADARVDNKFDLKGVYAIQIKPARSASGGSFKVDNIFITNKTKK